MGNRLQGIYDERTGKHAAFDYDAFDNLVKADYQENSKVDTIYRAPDAIGNLFESRDRTDRKYGKGGRLTEDPNYYYHYDCEGNLIFKEFKKPQGYSPWAKPAVEQKFSIRFKATTTGWYYKWAANGMLIRAVNPEMGKVDFGYDPLGRRTTKIVKNNIYHYFWAGNVVLHEWLETKEEARIKFVTWVYEDGSFIPVAKLLDDENYSIVSDYLGTPTHAYGSDGSLAWERELDIYGRPRKGDNEFIPFLYQGQYFDKETGLAYNRFRYYDPSIGSYISQDPIGTVGGFELYSYVKDTNNQLDKFGLSSGFVYGLHTNGDDFPSKGVHYGTHTTYPNGKKVEVSIRPDGKGGIIFKPSHPGQLAKAGKKGEVAFKNGVTEVQNLLKDPAERLKLAKFLDDLKGRYPEKGMEWNMLQKNIRDYH